MAELQGDDPVGYILTIKIFILQVFTLMGLSYTPEAGPKTSIHLLMLIFR